MKSLHTILVAASFSVVLTLGAQAAEFFLNANIPMGAHWNQAYWTNAATPTAIVPAPGNTYVNDFGSARTATSEDFLGDLLTLRSGRSVNLKHGGTVSVNLVMDNGSSIANGGSAGGMAGTLTGSGSITLNVSDFGGRPITLNSLLKSDNTFSRIDITGSAANNVTLTDPANTYTGLWNNLSGGRLKGAGLGMAAGFRIGSRAALDFDADYVNSNAYLTVLSGGTLILDQDLLFDTAELGPALLNAGTYTASNLWTDPTTSNAIDAASVPTAKLTVLTDPSAHMIAYFDFSATNGVSAVTYAYSDVGDWDLSNAGTGAAYTNATYPVFNGTANVAANQVGASASPVDGNYHSFSVTVQNMPPGHILKMVNLSLDYLYLTPAGFQLRIYTSVTGQNADTFTTGDTAIYDSGSIGGGSSTSVNVPLDDAAFQDLENGDSIEFRFVLTDGSGADYRIHGIDNVVLTGYSVPPKGTVIAVQ